MSLEEENQGIGSSFDIKPVETLIVEGELKAWIWSNQLEAQAGRKPTLWLH